MVPKSLEAVLITLPFADSADLVGADFVADGDGDAVSASEVVPPEVWLLEDGVCELPHPASTTAAVRTRATTERMLEAKHGPARQGWTDGLVR
jgi:hypothetical protein